MNLIESILAGLLIAIISGLIGNYISHRSNVSHFNCTLNRSACQNLLNEKLDNITEKVDSLTKMVNNKLLGL